MTANSTKPPPDLHSGCAPPVSAPSGSPDRRNRGRRGSRVIGRSRRRHRYSSPRHHQSLPHRPSLFIHSYQTRLRLSETDAHSEFDAPSPFPFPPTEPYQCLPSLALPGRRRIRDNDEATTQQSRITRNKWATASRPRNKARCSAPARPALEPAPVPAPPAWGARLSRPLGTQ